MAAKRQITTSEADNVREAREEAEVAAYNCLRDVIKDEGVHTSVRIRAAAVLVAVEPGSVAAKDG